MSNIVIEILDEGGNSLFPGCRMFLEAWNSLTDHTLQLTSSLKTACKFDSKSEAVSVMEMMPGDILPPTRWCMLTVYYEPPTEGRYTIAENKSQPTVFSSRKNVFIVAASKTAAHETVTNDWHWPDSSSMAVRTDHEGNSVWYTSNPSQLKGLNEGDIIYLARGWNSRAEMAEEIELIRKMGLVDVRETGVAPGSVTESVS